MAAMVRRTLAGLALVATLGLCAPVGAETLGDVRAELDLLNRQVQQIRDALVTTGAARGLPTSSATALTRLDQLEAELRRLTARVAVITNDIDEIVRDATNRVGDLEFRITELEGGDVSLLAPPAPLGGGVTPSATPVQPDAAVQGTPQLTVTEQSDFDAATAAAAAGEHARAAALFEAFLATYPGGPLAAEAQFGRGEALAAQADWRGAARSFLDAFSGTPDGPVAPRALFRLAGSLGKLGQTEEACLTLAEVSTRYPGSAVAGEVAAERLALRCP